MHQQNASTHRQTLRQLPACGCQHWEVAPAPKGWASFQPMDGCTIATLRQGRAGQGRPIFWGSTQHQQGKILGQHPGGELGFWDSNPARNTADGWGRHPVAYPPS